MSERAATPEAASGAMLVLGLSAGALLLRVWGNGFGLPDAVEPDEPKLVNHALAFGLGDLNPHYFVYPALQMYLLFACYGLLYVGLRALGDIGSVADYQVLFLSDPTLFYRTGRTLTALFGAASVAVLFVLGRQLYGSRTIGLLAALALAVQPLAVQQSHLVTADVPVTFFLLLGLVFLARSLESPRILWFALAGAAMGLGIATKYSGFILAVPVAAALALALRQVGARGGLVRLAVAAAATLVAFTAASPYSIIEWRETLAGMALIYTVKSQGQFGIASGSSWWSFTRIAFLQSPLALLSALGVAIALLRRTRADLLILSLAVPYFLTVGSSQSRSPRYLVPLVPLLLLLAARAVREAAPPGRRAARVLGAACAVALLAAAAESIAIDLDYLLPDTRREARLWIEDNVQAGTAIAVEYGGDTVRLREDSRSVEEKLAGYERASRQGEHHDPAQMAAALTAMRRVSSDRPAYRIVRLGENRDNHIESDLWDVEGLRRLDVRYVVTSSMTYGIHFDRAAFRRAYPEVVRFYDDLERLATEVGRFEPRHGQSRGPVIRVFGIGGGREARDAAPDDNQGGAQREAL